MKRGLVLFGLITTISLLVFVIAVETSKKIDNYGTINGNYVDSELMVVKGWNLVHGLPSPDWLFGDDILSDNIKAIYGFNHINQKFVRFYPNSDREVLGASDIRIEQLISGSSFWVYVDYEKNNAAPLEYWTLEPSEVLNNQLLEGWNFRSIMPSMIGKTFENIKGDCNIEKVYWWQPRDQSYTKVELGRSEVLKNEENLLSGLLIKVPSNCKLGDSGSDSGGPPGLPEGNDNQEILKEIYYKSLFENTCNFEQYLSEYYESEDDCNNVAICYSQEVIKIIPIEDVDTLVIDMKVSNQAFQIVANYLRNDPILNSEFKEKANNCLTKYNYKGNLL